MQIFFIEENNVNLFKRIFKPVEVYGDKIICNFCNWDRVPIAKKTKKTWSQLQKDNKNIDR